jgi:pyridoxal phosphate enzyme (YggS family)
VCPEAGERASIERLSANLAAVRGRIARAAERAGRDPDRVRLLAVTKSVAPETAALLAGEGQLDLGEARVQELERKADWLAGAGVPGVRWHLVGHLQRNKVRRAVVLAERVHSVDSLRLLEALEEAAVRERRSPRVYLELDLVRSSAGRTGLDPRELPELLARARDLVHVRPVGLMAMGPEPARGAGAGPGDPLEAQAASRGVFAELARIRERLRDAGPLPFEGGSIELSMGMSFDLEAAVAEGSDVVRVGTALFAGLASAAGAG